MNAIILPGLSWIFVVYVAEDLKEKEAPKSIMSHAG
jgi:hypothetical protein